MDVPCVQEMERVSEDGSQGFVLPRVTPSCRVGDVVADVVGTAVGNTVVMTVWGAKWVKHVWDFWRVGGSAGEFAQDVIRVLDDIEDDPMEYMETHVMRSSHVVVDGATGSEVERINSEVRKTKLKKGSRSKFAASVARIAYNKFGERPMSQANVLVTRKWLQKLLEEPQYVDLRVCDRNLAIDRALFLSFVPTKDFQMMKLATASRPWETRMRADSAFSGFWERVFCVGNLPDAEDYSQ
jgi:hypothetical protein